MIFIIKFVQLYFMTKFNYIKFSNKNVTILIIAINFFSLYFSHPCIGSNQFYHVSKLIVKVTDIQQSLSVDRT